MAKVGNTPKGKKKRGYSGSGGGLSKHRKSGAIPPNRRMKKLAAREVNAAAEAEQKKREARKPEMHESVAEALRSR
jgi:hypothetical protein